MWILTRRMKRKFIVVRIMNGDNSARFERIGHQTILDDVGLHSPVCRRECLIYRFSIADDPLEALVGRDVVPNLRGIRTGRGGYAHNGRQLLKIEFDQFGCVFRKKVGFSDDSRYRLPDIADALTRQRFTRGVMHWRSIGVVHDPARLHIAYPAGIEIRDSVDGDNTLRGPRRRCVDVTYTGMCGLRANDMEIRLAGIPDIASVSSRARDKAPVFLTPY